MLSYADLFQLGGYAAVEYCGGPSMIFRMGRKDLQEHELPQEGLLPNAHEKSTILERMLRTGFTKQDFVAIMGSHTIGFARMENTGFKGRWTQNPHVFDNSYYKEVLLGERSKFLQTPAETILNEEAELRRYVEMYAQDQNLFFSHYAEAHVKMSEWGQEDNLLSEFDNNKSSDSNGSVYDPSASQ